MLRVINLATGAIVAAYELQDETQTFAEFNPYAKNYDPIMFKKHEENFKDILAKRVLHNEAARRQARQACSNLNDALIHTTGKDSALYSVVNTGHCDEHLKPYFDITVSGG